MTEEIKEILENIKKQNEWEGVEYFRTPLSNEDADKLLNCITNLQQDLDKANDIIEKDRQFYKCRMDEYAELKKENEELNRMCELYSKSLYKAELTVYKSRCEKAIEHLKESLDILKGDSDIPIATGNVRNRYLKPVLNTLNGSDENE